MDWSQFRPIGLQIIAGTDGRCTGSITGQIDEALATELARTLAEEHCTVVHFLLASDGGDIDAAMRMGRSLRAANALAVTDRRRPCLSACVLLLVGAVSRSAKSGAVGVHSFYRDGGSASLEAATRAYEETRRDVRDYLVEMRVPEGLLDLIYSASPSEMRMLSDDEILATHLNGTDPVFADRRALRWSEALGISVHEFYRREALVAATCGEPGPALDGQRLLDVGGQVSDRYAQMYFACAESIRRGTSNSR